MLTTIYMTVADYWKLKEEMLLSSYKSKNNNAGRVIRNFILPVIGTLRISEVTVTDLERMVRMLREEGRSTGDLQVAKAILRKLFHYAVQDRLIKEDPVDSLAPIPTTYRELKGLSAEEEVRLLKIIRKTKRPELYTLMMITGISFRELAGCRICDFDEEGKKLTIRRSVTDRGEIREKKPRTLPLADEAVWMLKRAVERNRQGTSDDLIFRTAEGKLLSSIPWEDCKIFRQENGSAGTGLRALNYAFGIRALALGVNPKALNRYMGFRTGFNLTRYTDAGRRTEGIEL